MKLLQHCLRAGLSLALALPLFAQAGDEQTKKLSFDTTVTGTELKQDVAGLPLLVRLHSGNFGFAEARPDGADLRFFAADGKTALKFHLERYDAANELAVAWVRLPQLKANAKSESIVMRWGDKEAKPAADAAGSYDEAQLLVLNFSETDGFKDASANGNHVKSSDARAVAAGPIGGAVGFDGNSRVVVPASASLVLKAATGWTFTAWVKADALDKATLASLGGVSIELAGGAPVLRAGAAAATASGKLLAGTWQHLAVVHAAGKAQFFLNGEPAGEAAISLPEASGELVLGAGLRGEMDAVTLAATARSADYLKALASSQSPDSPLASFNEAAEEEGEISYFSILLGAVTLDGWIVIALLGVMAVVSLWVMYDKTRKLGRAEKANAAFLAFFKEHSVRLLDPQNPEVAQLRQLKAAQGAPLLALYDLGLHEIEQRFQEYRRTGRELTLTGPALESIRAGLDALIVRTNQRLNSGIVLLTISISGGPFLGLLGTVVGVMITFAAIAAAGDVNVNSIAPGIAAALVATVAGLAVAIPALFAYNWFAIKIKNIGADIAVFADELITRSAELHND